MSAKTGCLSFINDKGPDSFFGPQPNEKISEQESKAADRKDIDLLQMMDEKIISTVTGFIVQACRLQRRDP